MFRYIVAAVVVGLTIFFFMFLLPYFRQVPCPACGGKAIIQVGIVEVPCPYCRGRGKIADYYRDKVLQEMETDRAKQREKEQREATAIATQEMGNSPGADYQPAPAQ
jgi:RecJ-like exonuclease